MHKFFSFYHLLLIELKLYENKVVCHFVRHCEMSLSYNQRIALLEAYFECKSYERCKDVWRNKYPNNAIPSKETLYRLVRRFRNTGSVEVTNTGVENRKFLHQPFCMMLNKRYCKLLKNPWGVWHKKLVHLVDRHLML